MGMQADLSGSMLMGTSQAIIALTSMTTSTDLSVLHIMQTR